MKRITDLLFSIVGTVVTLPLFMVVIFVLIFENKGKKVIFSQIRIGKFGKPFTIYKFKTMSDENGNITPFGRFLRKSKLDELPQFFNIMKGDMSFVGPRPDIPGYYDQLKGNDRKVLNLKPGLTSEAGLKYRNEEELLANQKDPLKYNDEVLFPDKVRMNLHYLENQSLFLDLQIIFKTFLSLFKFY
ncbi:sugar transferase [Cloacibacterium normanense]|uniref:sugar transferase n=1 Tax=Cloacibacterium normanense TaxID=237258 RepID=UPI0035B0A6DC